MPRYLKEADYTDMTPLGEVLKRHAGQGLYIHFSNPKEPLKKQRSPNRVAKVGINPQKHHSDPPGVYFYPVDWLLQHPKFLKGDQWGTGWPHFVVADLDLSGPGLDLDKITRSQIAELGMRNGWMEMWEEFEIVGHKSDAHALWQFLKYLSQRREDRMPWLKSLKGLNFVSDTRGIIMSYEPEQVCAINPRIITIVERGQQRQHNAQDYETFDHWRFMILKLFKEITDRYPATVEWKNKFPKLTIRDGDMETSVEWRRAGWLSGLAVNLRNGDVSDSDFITPKFMRDNSYADVLEKLEDLISLTKAMSHDHMGETALPIQEATPILQRITNSTQKPEIDALASSPTYTATIRKEWGRVPVSSMARLSSDADGYTIRVEASIAGSTILYGSGRDEETLWTNVAKVFEFISQEFSPTSETSHRFEPRLWKPFLGYLYQQTGFSIFSQYQGDFFKANHDELYGEMEFVFGRITW